MNRLSVTHLTIVMTLVAGLIMLASVVGGDVTSVNTIQLVESPTATTYTINPTGVVQYQEYAMSNPSRLVIDLVGVKNGVQTASLRADGRLINAVRASQFQSEPDLVTRVVFELAEGTRYKVSRKGTAIEVAFSGNAPVMGADMGATKNTGSTTVPAPAVKEAASTAAPDPVAAMDAEPLLAEAAPKAMADSAPKAVTEAKPKMAADAAPKAVTEAKPKMAADAAPKAVTEAKPVEAPASTPAPKPMPVVEPVKQAAAPVPAWSVASPPVSNDDTAWPEPANAAVQPSDEIVMAQGAPRAVAGMATPVYGSELSNQPMTIDVQGADIKTVLRSISEFSGVNILSAPNVEGPVVIHLKNVPWKEALDTILKSQGYGWREDYGIIRVAPMDELQSDEVTAVSVERKKEEMQSLVTRVVKLDYLNAIEIKQSMSKVVTPRGTVEAEKGTNSVIVNEVPTRIDAVVALIVSMDKRLRQVEIVAKMVDVDATVTRDLGVQWQALNLQGANLAGDVVSGKNILDPFSQVRVGTVQSWGDLNLIIQALERDNKANIISNPRITTADNQEARIMVGKEIPLIVSDEAGNPITELKKIGVILQVTPHVNADGTITMDLHPELSDLASQATVQGGVIITLQEADTRVVVRDGETAVIGGLISDTETTFRDGVPILKDMPLIGPLFRHESKSKGKRELIIFVTPKVVG